MTEEQTADEIPGITVTLTNGDYHEYARGNEEFFVAHDGALYVSRGDADVSVYAPNAWAHVTPRLEEE